MPTSRKIAMVKSKITPWCDLGFSESLCVQQRAWEQRHLCMRLWRSGVQQKEIAAHLGVTPPAVWVKINKARLEEGRPSPVERWLADTGDNEALARSMERRSRHMKRERDAIVTEIDRLRKRLELLDRRALLFRTTAMSKGR